MLRDIESILVSLPQDCRCNFNQIQVERCNNLGTTVKSKAYQLTRNGFTFLVMGYNGEKASRFKWAYINEFNWQQASLESKTMLQKPIKRMTLEVNSLGESALKGLSGQIDSENVGDKLVTIGTVLQVVGAI